MEWVPVAQAETEERLGPFAPYLMEMWPGARLMISIGMKKGEIFLYPPSCSAEW